ncbi:hypothetical protein BDW69DRAFT_17411 [Aspergillus filifer]
MRRYHSQIRHAHRWLCPALTPCSSTKGQEALISGGTASYPIRKALKEVLFILIRTECLPRHRLLLGPPLASLESAWPSVRRRICPREDIPHFVLPAYLCFCLRLGIDYLSPTAVATASESQTKCHSSYQPHPGHGDQTHGPFHSTDRFHAPIDRDSSTAQCSTHLKLCPFSSFPLPCTPYAGISGRVCISFF